MGPETVARRTVGEWVLTSDRAYASPFADVVVTGAFTAPDGTTTTIPGFHDGDGTWRVRFNPGVAGKWSYRIAAHPANPALATEGAFVVTERDTPGFLKATPGMAWGWHYENGDPAFIFGDTVYNLFGMAHCGADVRPFLERRKAQGFNLLRVRVPVSPFHPPAGYNQWQTCRTWAWGGSEQSPRFDLFNVGYFATVDRVVQMAEEIGIGLELIMEGWGFEFPFNSRTIFTAEWEELWMRYLIARYDAYACTLIWTPLNEYEYYPNGDWNYKPVADRWAMRVARWIKREAGHGHPVAMHNGPRLPPFAERFAADPDAVDAILYQEWGTRGEHDGWLAAGIEEQIDRAFDGWGGSAIFAEWGYERNPAFENLMPSHEFCDVDHTRRGAWRGAMRGMGIIHGFENSWGPWMMLDEDQPGMTDLLNVHHFFTKVVPFHTLRRAADDWESHGDVSPGSRPSVLISEDNHTFVFYMPVATRIGGGGERSTAQWYDPRTGDLSPATIEDGAYIAPSGGGDRPHDWVLIVTK